MISFYVRKEALRGFRRMEIVILDKSEILICLQYAKILGHSLKNNRKSRIDFHQGIAHFRGNG